MVATCFEIEVSSDHEIFPEDLCVMDVYSFFKQRTDLIRHFYDAASTPFLETKKCIEDALPPFDNPPYDDSGEPAFLSEWLRADVEHELIGRTAGLCCINRP